jgi:hypothetical protein
MIDKKRVTPEMRQTIGNAEKYDSGRMMFDESHMKTIKGFLSKKFRESYVETYVAPLVGLKWSTSFARGIIVDLENSPSSFYDSFEDEDGCTIPIEPVQAYLCALDHERDDDPKRIKLFIPLRVGRKGERQVCVKLHGLPMHEIAYMELYVIFSFPSPEEDPNATSREPLYEKHPTLLSTVKGFEATEGYQHDLSKNLHHNFRIRLDLSRSKNARDFTKIYRIGGGFFNED